MALSPQKFREIVLQLLYSREVTQSDPLLLINLMSSELEVSKKNIKLALERVELIKQNLKEIDEKIKAVSISYEFDRIQQLSKCILRLSVFELFFDETIPYKVAIAEAIRLSRKFNTPESASFVNALLDQLYQKSIGAIVNRENLEKESKKFESNEQEIEQLIQESILPNYLETKENEKSE